MISWKNQILPKTILLLTLDVSVEPVILMKFAPASVASAFAIRVLPVPGGPKSNIPLQGCRKKKKLVQLKEQQN